jgi:hypothetical protein
MASGFRRGVGQLATRRLVLAALHAPAGRNPRIRVSPKAAIGGDDNAPFGLGARDPKISLIEASIR